VLQTVFLRILRRGWTAEGVANLETYLHRAAVNAALDLVRARKEKVPIGEVAPLLRGDARLEPGRRQSSGELRSKLRDALARLAPKAAEIFALRYFEGLENSEIARMLDTTVTNVAVSLHRSRSQLKTELRPYLETGYEH
jgi:RNA polymerase sigma-70 factor (ECF subfamily)